MTGSEGNNSISDVVKQPAFIAGLGGACWIVLMGFRPGCTGGGRRGRDSALCSSVLHLHSCSHIPKRQRPHQKWKPTRAAESGGPRPPWLADSWPSTSLPANGLGSPKGGSNFGRGDVLPSAAVEKTGTMLSDGAIYSSIDFMGKAGYSSPARGIQPTPYATTQILQSNSFHELAVDRPDPRWKASLQAQQEMANLGYSLTDRRPGNGAKVGKKKKVKGGTKASKSNGRAGRTCPCLHHPCTPSLVPRYDSNSWAPPMSVQTYRHQGLDNEEEDDRGPTPPLRGRSSSPATASFSQPSSSSLSSTHHDEMQCILQAHLDELTRAYQYEVAKQHMKGSPNVSTTPVPPMDFMSSTLGSDLGATLLSEEDEDMEEEERYAMVSKNLCGFEYTPGHSVDNLDGSDLGTQSTHSLGHKRATLTGLKPQTGKVGTLPRRRDTNTDAHHTGRKFPAQCGFPHAQLMGSCGLRPL
ncbi:hypothetical protein F7725_007234 [Dissostichus mawsoni]|uniref:Uncharacterized protein n=1 Tax=Dissostichus mawsoni TaxID=36200 RepID=A0A7J5XWA2_DISMA|nr:hypothetical protein F7725_007234 [Dissostichus mawsoni]